MNMHKIAFFIAIISLMQGISLMPSLPRVIYYLFFGLTSVYYIKKYTHFNFLIFLFVIVSLISIALNDIPDFFQSKERFIGFLILLIFIGPLILNSKLTILRKLVFEKLTKLIIFLSSFSFITYLLGISFPFSATGPNSGFFNHSLMLGPFAAISMLILIYLINTKNKKFNKRSLQILLILSFLSLLISSSRSSIIGFIIAFPFLIYKLNHHKFTNVALTLIGGAILILVTMPIWEQYTIGIKEKFESFEDGRLVSSRELHWNARIYEFNSSPIYGIGFASADINSPHAIGFDLNTGIIESGSSWMSLLSMTGVLGFAIIAIFFLRILFFLLKDKINFYDSGILLSLLVFFIVHMNAEGYILASGSLLFFFLWLLLGVIYSYKNRYILKL